MTETTRVLTADGTSVGVHHLPADESREPDGPLVVGLHGFTTSGAAMLPLLERIRDGRPALAIDLVGHGVSDAPEHLEPYQMSSVVDQVLSVIGPRPPGSVHLVGYSMGGRVCMSLAARAPWYFASLVTLSSTPGIEDPVERAARQERDGALADHIESVGTEAFIEEWLANDMFAPYVDSLDPTRRNETLQLRSSASATGLANSLRGTGTGAMPPVWNTLPSIQSPILAVAGALDSRFVDLALAVQEKAPSARAEIVDGAGHVVHEENPDRVTYLVADFLQCCDRERDRRA